MPLQIIGTRAKNRRLAVLAGVVAATALLGMGTAYAYYATSGSGSGTIALAAGVPAFTTASATPTGAMLHPGSSGIAIVLRVDNTASSSGLIVTSLARDTGRPITADRGHADCTAADLTVTPASVSIVVPAGATSAALTIDNVVAMGAAAQSACQGATLTIPLTLTGRTS